MMRTKEKEKIFENPIYIVIWKDAHTINETLSEREIKKEEDVEVTTIGILIDENKERIALCGFRFGKGKDAGYRDTHFIPKKLIKRIGILKEISKETYKKIKKQRGEMQN